MGIKYEIAEDIQKQVNEIALMLFPHVKLDSVVCLRSYGSSSRGTIARCHALGKAMQLALGRKGFYVIEVINKRFDKMHEIDKTKTLIHELMHIPKTFGGGFIHHDVVHERNVERMYQHYCNLKKNTSDKSDILIDKSDEMPMNNKTDEDNEFFIVKKRKNWWF
jgi:predicted metallopeptidase